MTDWQPIETALDVGYDGHVLVSDGMYVTIARMIEGQWWELNNHPTDHWGDQLYPTVWMRLPDSPDTTHDQPRH